MFTDGGIDLDDVPFAPPPGEEAFNLSHKGGEHEAFIGLTNHIKSLGERCYVDPCLRSDQVEVQTCQWTMQMDHLVDAYLKYHLQVPDGGVHSVPSSPEDDATAFMLSDIELVDIFGRHQMSLSPSPQHVYPNETLICYGYLGCSPVFPSVAISIRTLSLFHQQH
ncbi:hypothetical protein PISMIDRAFT_119472 [Pisolithus microcarpus 441]|uniref:Uncharacterized protein n=1 Tax=Pisolithus microcarpus 441 TaxID=765257 RepID=A0A0C9Y877_9AGAM|nr:hypothetical protein BKA83DRAFT_119472 [Pisolithus microcarpus]KIK13131.1 hypothetical protein PISMIDRAFT_119472 [Pisolithus microcarpus 441]